MTKVTSIFQIPKTRVILKRGDTEIELEVDTIPSTLMEKLKERMPDVEIPRDSEGNPNMDSMDYKLAQAKVNLERMYVMAYTMLGSGFFNGADEERGIKLLREKFSDQELLRVTMASIGMTPSMVRDEKDKMSPKE